LRRQNRPVHKRLDQVLDRVKRTYAESPLEEIGRKFESFIEQSKAAIEAGIARPGQEKATADYVEDGIQSLPRDFAERFFFDSMLIQETISDWNHGVAKLPHMIIPRYADTWGHQRVLMPPEDEDQVHLVDVILLPGRDSLDEIDLLSYPWLFHELGHTLLFRYDLDFISEFEVQLKARLNGLRLRSIADRGSTRDKSGKLIQTISNSWWPTPNQRNWAHEIAADIVALWTCGAAFLATFQDKIEQDSIKPYAISKNHPSYEVRALALVGASEMLGWQEHSIGIKEIIAKWSQISASRIGRNNQYIACTDPTIIEACMSCALASCEKLKLPRCSQEMVHQVRQISSMGEPPRFGAPLLLTAWLAHNENAEAFDQWEKQTIQKLAE